MGNRKQTKSNTGRGSKYHPLVAAVREELSSAQTGPEGKLLSHWNARTLDLSVSRKLLSRGCKLCDNLIVALEKKGFRVKIDSQDTRHGTVAMKNGHKIRFCIDEKINLEKYVPTPKEEKDLREGRIQRWEVKSQVKTLSGVLRVRLRDMEFCGIRTEWKDSKTRPVEENFEAVLSGFDDAYTYFEGQEKARKVREEEWQSEEAIREAEKQRKEELQRRFSSLEEIARASRLREDLKFLFESLNDDLTAEQREKLSSSIELYKEHLVNHIKARIDQL